MPKKSGSPVRQRALAGLLTALLLGGCASPPVLPDNTVAGAAARRYHAAIELDGRLSVRYQRNDREEALHGSFAWSQTAARTLVTLNSPLGQTLATIELTPQGATLIQPGQPARNAADADALAADALGWPLPVANLGNWLQGYALDAHGRRIAAAGSADPISTPDGWQIRYPAWQQAGSAAGHPKRIDLARRSAAAGEIAIRIVIDNWQPLP
ncbi:outer membrane lipoprotein LolB [Herminiimonas sp. CN]|uniref:outer membrane lipoprotein LolB n=1 Tax=Herminiimonas sp. CN TaxID=1349818 RepID=UPI00047308BE|nr:outer membrane lipoprotein LolB [Herminiimonas sp. CN]